MISRFLSFNYNTDNLIYCNQLYDNDELQPEEGLLFKRKACYSPNFFNDLSNQIVKYGPELVAITTHGDNKNSYLHTDFLEDYMYDLSYLLLNHKQYKNINMSIYIKNIYEPYYLYLNTDTYTIANSIDTMAIYLNSDLGKLVFIGIDRADSYNEIKEINSLVKQMFEYYIDSSINFYFIMAHISGYNEYNKHHYVDNGVYNKNTDYIIEKTETTLLNLKTQHDAEIDIYDIIKKNPSIICFSWNTDQTPLCDKIYKPLMDQHVVEGIFNSYECYNPNFFMNIEQKIKEYNPNIVVFNNEGDLEKGTYFHYQFLPNYMKKLEYSLLEKDKLNDIGFKNDKESMRLSIYIRKDVNVELVHINKTLFSYNENVECKKVYKNGIVSKTKALVKYVNTQEGLIAFLSVQIPHHTQLENIEKCLKKIKDELLKSGKISYVFMMGDFSYEHIKIENTEVLSNANENLSNDYNLKYENLIDFEEGNYMNPNYAFKSIEVSQRMNYSLSLEPEKYIQKDDKAVIAWHDRIYYKTNDITTHDIDCLEYDNLYGFPMLHKNSHHVGVLGVYQLNKID